MLDYIRFKPLYLYNTVSLLIDTSFIEKSIKYYL